MRTDNSEQIELFAKIRQTLINISIEIETEIKEALVEKHHVDKISCRVKTVNSYKGKINKEKDGKLKYETPIKEIQDLIGARVVVYYKQTADEIFDFLSKYFTVVERTRIIPDEPSKFGYEGLHLICLISPIIINKYMANDILPDFFELQIKTLYQHAWGQAEHGLGYKPGGKLEIDEKRKLAFIAAQSWGADEILSDLYNSKLK